MPANSSDKLKQISGTELCNLFPKYHSKLDEYVRSAKTMDEQAFRSNFENDKGTLPLCFIQLTGIPINLYRSRLERKVGEKEDLTSPQTFSYVPLTSTNEHFPNLQRANFSGQSIFYGSLSPTTNFREISEDVTAGEEVYMAKWNISPNANLMLYKVFPPKETFLNDKFQKIFELKKEECEAFGAFFQKLGDIMMSTGEGKAKYLVSALCANFVYNFPPMTLPDGSKIGHFDGILYPSTKMEDGSELNMAKDGTQRGGAVYWYGVNGMISNSRFINNTSYNGGAIFWDSNSLDGVVNNCSFIKNDGGDGGAVYWFGANGRMVKCDFINNTATNGGAINWQRTYGLVDGCNFINNTATKGGAVYWEGTNGTGSNCNFTNNAADNGGAICWYGYNGTLNNSKFEDNKATQNGGAIAITGDVAKIDNVKLINSTASGSGGAIYVGAKGSVISNSELSANSASDGTDNIAIGLDGEASLTDNVTTDKGPAISFVTEINATCAGDVYQGGNPIVINIKTNAKKGTVSITVKGKVYTATVKDGVATITISDLAAGTYKDVAVGYHDFTGDYGDAGDNVTFTVKASEAKIISKDIKKDYNSNYKYSIRIIGVDGKPVNGAKIKISINGKAKTYKTDSKGYITIKLDKTYTPGKYTVKLSYKGITSKHVITIKQILKAKKIVKIKKSAKKVVLKASLKSSNGKAIKGKKITFKVKGKTYRAKTNKKGIAMIVLKNKVIKKLRAGRTYTVKITYLKDTITTKLKVKK